MFNNKKILGLIVARGGSKGLPRKNILPLNGQPLIGWSIKQALASKYLDKVIVSTDDDEIADISKQYGAAVPFRRPAQLATDGAKTLDVIIHALNFLEDQGQSYDYLVLLEPTSPLRESEDIDKCLEILENNRTARAIVSVAKLESGHPDFNVTIDQGTGLIRKIDGTTNFKVIRRQDLKDVFFFDGTIYVSDVQTLLEKETFYHELTLAYIVPKWKSFEIDDIYDFWAIENIMKHQRGIT
jgi:CMP-N,N'-diacetyllegionaminic acid synthase